MRREDLFEGPSPDQVKPMLEEVLQYGGLYCALTSREAWSKSLTESHQPMGRVPLRSECRDPVASRS